MSRKRRRIENPDRDESIAGNVFPTCEGRAPRHLTTTSASLEDSTSGTQPGIVNVSGEASLHQGDNIGVHHHYYGTAKPLQKSMFDSRAYGKLLESLSFERMDARLRNVTTALSDTCTWIFHHEKFMAWNDENKRPQHNGFLWIKGKPGCGKSTIMKTTLNWAHKNWPEEWIIVSYFFNARAPSVLEKSSLGLYQSVTHQLLSALTCFEQPFLKSFSSKIRDNTVEEWSTTELQEFLVEIAQSTQRPPLCLFIDALDEGEEDDVRSMVDFLEAISSQATFSNQSFRICLSSRHYPNITIGQALYLTIEDELEHGRDLEIYINKKLRPAGTQVIGDLREQLIRKSEKIFLWVTLVIPMLNKAYDHGGGPKAMSMLLKDIPKGLSGLFSDILSKHTDCFDECVILLRWILFSARPLNPQELYLAILHTKYTDPDINFQEEEEAAFDPSRVQRCILEWSRGLVEVTTGAAGLKYETTIQFIHETVRDYLLFSQEVSQIVPALSFDVQGASHEIMKNACVRYLASKQHQFEEVKVFLTPAGKIAYAAHKSPFMDYSTHSLFYHADTAQQHGTSQGSFVLSQMQRDRVGPVDWYAIFESTTYRPCDNTLLRPIVDNNLQYLAQTLVKESVDLRLIDLPGKTASLRIACEMGYEEVARCLIECGAYNSSVRETLADDVLRAACEGGSLETVRLLVDRGADVNAGGGCALQAACVSGHLAVAKLLLDRGADANARGLSGPYGNALCAASHQGRLGLVQLLVNKGADVNACGLRGDYDNAITAACTGGHVTIAELLLDRGADVNAHSQFYSNALVAASLRGFNEIVELLLDRQADIDAQVEPHWTVLTAVAMTRDPLEGHERTMRLLIDRGADAKAGNSAGNTALCMAAEQGSLRLVQILLDAGAGDRPDGACDEAEVRNALKVARGGLTSCGNRRDDYLPGCDGQLESKRKKFRDIVKMLEQKLRHRSRTGDDDEEESESREINSD